MKRDLTPSKFIFILFVISLFTIAIVNYYGGHFKDSVTKATCPLIGEEYLPGISKGEGRCIIPVGTFD
ncbi:MAG: hypothetical protein PHF21_03255 [Bacilli bacterium]|nr:hypothetical protein [Bacilli bacterium]